MKVRQDNVPDKDTSHLEVDRKSVSVDETSIFTYYAKNSVGQKITDDSLRTGAHLELHDDRDVYHWTNHQHPNSNVFTFEYKVENVDADRDYYITFDKKQCSPRVHLYVNH